jgi:hypothetical protein
MAIGLPRNSLARIHPRNKKEAIAVFSYLAEKGYTGRHETNDILLNLIGRFGGEASEH